MRCARAASAPQRAACYARLGGGTPSGITKRVKIGPQGGGLRRPGGSSTQRDGRDHSWRGPNPARAPAWRIPLLLGILVLAIGVFVVVHRRQRVELVEIPEPGPSAIAEPPPAEGAEGATLARARTLLDNFELNEAEAVLAGVLRENPKSAIAHAYLARAAYRRGQRRDGTCSAEAAAAAEREAAVADSIQPGIADAKLVRAYLQYLAGNLPRAKELGLEAERLDPTSVRIRLCLAQIAMRARDFDEADRRATALVLGLREGYVLDGAYSVLGDVYEGRHEYGRKGALKHVIARHPRFDGPAVPR